MTDRYLQSSDEQALLAEINRYLPPDVDWKAGAQEYLAAHLAQEGEWSEIYHLIKPFCGGPDFSTFFEESYRFLNLVQVLQLPPRSRLLDVGCGPGWVSHFLAKLGHRVVGIDISEQMVDLARRRIDLDPVRTYAGEALAASFLVHDIERTPLVAGEEFDVAVFESSLHHFSDPLAALRHTARSVAAEGSIAVLEGVAPTAGSAAHEQNLAVMRRYRTLERPYTRRQIVQLLELAGFGHVTFYLPLNGFFAESEQERLRDVIAAASGSFNYLVATRPLSPRRSEPVQLGHGWYDEETDEHGRFRWSRNESSLQARGPARLRLDIGSHYPALAGRSQTVTVLVDDQPVQQLTLTVPQPAAEVELEIPPHGATVSFFSDSCFSPRLHGQDDRRTLSFTLRLHWQQAEQRPGETTTPSR